MFDENELTGIGVGVYGDEPIQVPNVTTTAWLMINPRFTTPIDTPQAVLLEILVYSLGETLIAAPGDYNDAMTCVQELYGKLGPLDKAHCQAIYEEIQKHYNALWHDQTFYGLNFSDAGFYKYVTTIYDTTTRFVLFADPDFKIGYWE
ncbi:hypothetical protein [Aeromonas phage AerS_266]|nr:hypothetical protein [Aeromonas phage AerS_266]